MVLNLIMLKDVLIEYQANVGAEIFKLVDRSEAAYNDFGTILDLREQYYSTDYTQIDYEEEFKKLNLEFFMLTYAYKKFYKVIGYSTLAAS